VGDNAGDQMLEVLGQSTVAAQVGEGALDHPATRLDGEADLIGLGADDGHVPAEGGLDPVLELALVGAIRPQLLDAWELLVRSDQEIEATISILLVGGMDVDAQDQPEGIHQQVPLAAEDLFSPRRSRARHQPRSS
jgi:hypothetical protein